MIISDLEQLAEGCDLEVKKALGKQGKGELPRSTFETYSAMANTAGGVILLGVEELPDGGLAVVGIPDLRRLQKELWDSLNNPQRVSANLLTDESVQAVEIAGKKILRIEVPRATRQQRPVYINGNPLSGTYRRNFEGDYRCEPEAVRRMLAEQVEDARDNRILDGFSIEDLDTGTIKAYRNRLRATKPEHPWISHDDQEFLRVLGAWRRDRETGKQGMTLAGMLMFGRLPEILEAVPNYVVDYQERPEAKTEYKWIDRVTTDGTWSGNLFDFYRIVIQKLFRDLKVPFRLKGTERVDETPVHEALREALVNTLIHADYSGRVSVLVVKRPDMFGFRNPGAMRVPPELARKGGISDCRNRTLQKMFQLVGLAEQAGSGLPKVYNSWKRQHWRAPELWEETEPEQTLFALRMVSLLPDETLAELDRRFGSAFRALSRVQQLALATVSLERKVTHSRLKSMTDDHARDISLALRSLVTHGYLSSSGAGRGTYYYFPGEPPIQGEAELFGERGTRQQAAPGSEQTASRSEQTAPGSEQTAPRSEQTALGSEQTAPGSEQTAPGSEQTAPGSEQTAPGGSDLERLAAHVRDRSKAPRKAVMGTILELCRGRHLTLAELAHLLGRTPDTIRVHYLRDLLDEGRLRLRFPDKINHPEQAYTTVMRTQRRRPARS